MDTELPDMGAGTAEGAEAHQGRGASYDVLHASAHHGAIPSPQPSVQGASYYVLPTSDGSLVCFTLAPGTAPAACAALY